MRDAQIVSITIDIMAKKCNVPTHPRSPPTWAKTYPCYCPECGQKIFYFECGHGSKIFFQELGPPWRDHFKHGLCPNQGSSSSIISRRRTIFMFAGHAMTTGERMYRRIDNGKLYYESEVIETAKRYDCKLEDLVFNYRQ